MPGVFISYRRIDSTGFAGRLFDHLSRHFGRNRVFIDNEGGIERGADFPTVIEQAVQASDAMIVVIGRQWLNCVDAEGQQRLNNPADWVRNEVASALKRNILLLPVLVDGATMPVQEQLPENLQRLARKQASEITSSRWDYDVGQLIKMLERVMPPERTPVSPWRTRALWAIPAGAALAAALWFYGFHAAPITPPQSAPPAQVQAGDLQGFWRDDDGKLYRLVRREGGGFDMGRIEPPETDPVYRVVQINNRSIEIAIGVLPSGTQQGVANLELSVDGNIMSGLLKSTQIEDTPQNWVLRRSAGESTTPARLPQSKAAPDAPPNAAAQGASQKQVSEGLPTRQSQTIQMPGDVRSVAFTSDSKLLAAGGSENVIRTWIVNDRQEWQESRRLGQSAQRSTVEAIAFSPDGRLLASAHLDGNARIWNLETGRLIHTLNHGGIVYSIAFSHDGASLFSGGFDKSVRQWNVDNGRPSLSSDVGIDIRVMALSPDGRLLALGGGGKQIRIWDVASWQLSKSLDSPPGNWVVKSLAFSPKGQWLAVAIADGHMKLWDMQKGEVRSGQAGAPLTFSAKADWMAFAQKEKISLQEVVSGQELGRLAGHSEPIESLALSRDGRWLASGDGSGMVKLWR